MTTMKSTSMTRTLRLPLLAASVVALLGVAAHGQGPQGGRGGAPAAPGGGRGGPVAAAMTVPNALIPNAKPVRSCEGLAAVALPNTTIESAAVDAANPGICRVTAPGVTHCAGGPGPQPTGQLEALLAWVEDGKAPEILTATRRDQGGAVTRSRPLCQYPQVAKDKGSGSTDDAASFTCNNGF